MRRMKRHNPKRKRSNPPLVRRRRRRNPEAAAAAKKPRKKPPTVAQRQAALFAQLVQQGLMTPEVATRAASIAAPKPRGPKTEPKWKRDGFDNAQQAKDAAAKSRGAREAENLTLKNLKASIRARIKAGEDVTAEERAVIARKARKPRTFAARAKGERGFKRKAPTKGRGFEIGRRVVQGRAIAAGDEKRLAKLRGQILGTSSAFNKTGTKLIPIRSARSYAASLMAAKGNSKEEKRIASAWRAAIRAKDAASTPADRARLRAMGLADVPNPSAMSLLGDIKKLMPQIAGASGGFVGAAVLGQVAFKFLPDAHKEKGWAKAVPSVVSLAIAGAGFAALRMSKNKSISSVAPYFLVGGTLAAALHAIVRVKVGDQTIAQKLGLPLGEYASMAGYGEYASMAGHHGMGEYASMAGGTSYSGERGIFSGLDDTDPVLSGTDDEDEVDMVETMADEGVNVDEGSLNGSIFD